MTLMEAPVDVELLIKDIKIEDEALNSFLFSLGCYTGEPITIIRKRKSGCVVAIKDGRYNIDKQLASSIIVEA